MASVRAVLDFLTENGFAKAASALLEDVVDRGGVGVNDYPPLLPPVRTAVDRAEPADVSSDLSFSSDEFVSFRRSPAQGVPAEADDDDNDNDDDSSSGISEFGTARAYDFPNIFSDSNWYDEKFGAGSRDQDVWKKKDPAFTTETSISCLSRPEGEEGTGCEDCTKVYGSYGSRTELKVRYDSSAGLGSSDSSCHENSFVPAKTRRAPDCVDQLSSHPHQKSIPVEPPKDVQITSSLHNGGTGDPQPRRWDGDGDSLEFSFQNLNHHREENCIDSQLPGKDLPMVSLSSDHDSFPANDGQQFDYEKEKPSKYHVYECITTGLSGENMYSYPVLHSNVEKASQSELKDAWPSEVHENFSLDQENQDVTFEGRNDFDSDGLLLDQANVDTYEIFDLRIIHRKNRTGFEENKDIPIVMNSVIAGRYYVTEYLGSAAFSKVIQARDLQTGIDVCLKIIKNDKDFFDQSLDEIKLLKLVNKYDPNDDHHILRLYDYFYHQEHLFIVCELLKANLYEFQKYNQESGGEIYYTLSRIQSIAKQCLKALEFMHHLGIIHCDLKPENILIKSYSRCEIKIIDLGSSCFRTDNLTFYVQSRSYRAPEVILGVPYDQKIDIWSVGCILAELFSSEVLFPNDSVSLLLSRVIAILGPFDMEMLRTGKEVHKYFTDSLDVYHKDEDTDEVQIIICQKTPLSHLLNCSDSLFINFLKFLLQTNPQKRPTAAEALHHPWLHHKYN